MANDITTIDDITSQFTGDYLIAITEHGNITSLIHNGNRFDHKVMHDLIHKPVENLVSSTNLVKVQSIQERIANDGCLVVFTSSLFFDAEHNWQTIAMEGEDNRILYIWNDNLAQNIGRIVKRIGADIDDMHFCTNSNLLVTEASSSFATYLGYNTTEILNRNFEDFVAPSDLPDYIPRALERVSGKKGSVIRHLCKKDGSIATLHLIALPIIDGDKNQLVGIEVTVSESRGLTQWNTILEKFFLNSDDGFVITDADTRVIEVNAAFENITKYDRSEIIGKYINILTSNTHSIDFYHNFSRELHENGKWKGFITNKNKNGEHFTVQMTAAAIRNDKGKITNFIGIFNNITEFSSYLREIEKLNTTNPVTKLKLRNTAASEFDRISLQAKNEYDRTLEYYIILICLPELVNIATNHGESALQHAQKEATKRINEIAKDADIIFFINDELFGIIYNKDNIKPSLLILTERLLSELKEIIIDNKSASTHCALGVAIYPGDGKNFEELYNNARLGLQDAMQNKNYSKRIGLYSNPLKSKAKRKFELERNLREAIDNHEIELYFQPQIEMSTNSIVGAEALARWKHDGVHISPAEFIPLAEETCVIESLGHEVIRLACLALLKLHSFGIQMQISINVSIDQLSSNEFADRFFSTLTNYAIDTKCIEIEITESKRVADAHAPEAVINCLQQLRNKGVSIAMDDFGTACANLRQLLELRPNKLKIDQTFTANILSDDFNAAMIVSLIAMLARQLEIKFIAEGVENEKQRDYLLRTGCKYVQGYLYSRPLQLDDFISFYKKHESKGPEPKGPGSNIL